MRAAVASMLLGACLYCTGCSRAIRSTRVPPGVYLLPHEGGVGMGKVLQMTIVEVPRMGLSPDSRNEAALGAHHVAWKSSNTSIARVDHHGKVLGRQPGTGKS